MDQELAQLRRELAQYPTNYCLRRLLSTKEMRLGIKGKPFVLVVAFESLVYDGKRVNERYCRIPEISICNLLEINKADWGFQPIQGWLYPEGSKLVKEILYGQQPEGS